MVQNLNTDDHTKKHLVKDVVILAFFVLFGVGGGIDMVGGGGFEVGITGMFGGILFFISIVIIAVKLWRHRRR